MSIASHTETCYHKIHIFLNYRSFQDYAEVVACLWELQRQVRPNSNVFNFNMQPLKWPVVQRHVLELANLISSGVQECVDYIQVIVVTGNNSKGTHNENLIAANFPEH